MSMDKMDSGMWAYNVFPLRRVIRVRQPNFRTKSGEQIVPLSWGETGETGDSRISNKAGEPGEPGESG